MVIFIFISLFKNSSAVFPNNVFSEFSHVEQQEETWVGRPNHCSSQYQPLEASWPPEEQRHIYSQSFPGSNDSTHSNAEILTKQYQKPLSFTSHHLHINLKNTNTSVKPSPNFSWWNNSYSRRGHGTYWTPKEPRHQVSLSPITVIEFINIFNVALNLRHFLLLEIPRSNRHT